MKVHPCLKCGACCAFYRVSFHWSETLSDSFNVPDEFVNELTSHMSVMKGTNKRDPQCMALKGKVGEYVTCSIYEQRPSCCRNFKASYEDGVRNKRCDEARISKGLKPLKPQDWDTPIPLPSEKVS